MKFLYSNSYLSKAYKKLNFIQFRSFFHFCKSNADLKYINNNFSNFNSKIETIRSLYSLPYFLNEVLNGIMLGDGHLSKSSLTSNAKLQITFSGKYVSLANYINGLFCFYINPKGYYKNKVQSGYNSKFYDRIQLTTVALPVFTKYHNLYYKLYNNKYIKIIPFNITEILIPLSLAFFLMGDGGYNKTRRIITISTNNFSKEEFQLLSNTLYKNFNLETRIELVMNNSYILIIRTSQVPLLQK